jgi:hypothetical protein
MRRTDTPRSGPAETGREVGAEQAAAAEMAHQARDRIRALGSRGPEVACHGINRVSMVPSTGLMYQESCTST